MPPLPSQTSFWSYLQVQTPHKLLVAKPVPASLCPRSPAPVRRPCAVLAAWASAVPSMAGTLGTVGTVWHREFPRCCRILSAVTSPTAHQADQYLFGQSCGLNFMKVAMCRVKSHLYCFLAVCSGLGCLMSLGLIPH